MLPIHLLVLFNALNVIALLIALWNTCSWMGLCRVHGVVVAELPLVATCSGYRRQGMCRRLIKAIEEVSSLIRITEKLFLDASCS